ncbi:MAG TPA: hypothetical protein VFZ64_16305 [Nocardioidaceae bacterium]
MREILGWMVEQICRPLDTKVCAIANMTDEPDPADGFPGYYLGG